MTEEHNADHNVTNPVFMNVLRAKKRIVVSEAPAPNGWDFDHCMAPGCEEPIRARGHCATHYRTLRAIVNNPKTEYTWKILGDAGVVPLRSADEYERVDTAGFRDEILTKLDKASDQKDLTIE